MVASSFALIVGLGSGRRSFAQLYSSMFMVGGRWSGRTGLGVRGLARGVGVVVGGAGNLSTISLSMRSRRERSGPSVLLSSPSIGPLRGHPC
jgi:hypothetical protein